MLAAGQGWKAIGLAIGWTGDAARDWFVRHELGDLLAELLQLRADAQCHVISELLPPAGDAVCLWRYDSESMFWQSSCGQEHSFDHGPLGDGWKFCPFCSKLITELADGEKSS